MTMDLRIDAALVSGPSLTCVSLTSVHEKKNLTVEPFNFKHLDVWYEFSRRQKHHKKTAIVKESNLFTLNWTDGQEALCHLR